MADDDRYYREALDHMARGDYEKAIRALTEAIRINPSNPEFYMKRGDAYIEAGEFHLSTVDYDKANNLR